VPTREGRTAWARFVGALFGVAADDAGAGIGQGAKVYWVAADMNCSASDGSGTNKLIRCMHADSWRRSHQGPSAAQ
jgi:hypothetical protein